MLVTFGFITPMVAVVLLIIALIIFGPGKLPALGKGLGKTIHDFRTETKLDEGKE